MFSVFRLTKVVAVNGTEKTSIKQLEQLQKKVWESGIMKKTVV